MLEQTRLDREIGLQMLNANEWGSGQLGHHHSATSIASEPSIVSCFSSPNPEDRPFILKLLRIVLHFTHYAPFTRKTKKTSR